MRASSDSTPSPVKRDLALRVAAGTAILVAGAFIAYAVASRARPTVEWSAVLDAAASRKTMHAIGVVTLADGSQWDYTLWRDLAHPLTSRPAGMIRPREQEAAVPPEPDPELLRLCEAMDYRGERGLVTLLAQTRRPGRATRAEWDGHPALMVEVRPARDLRRAGGDFSDLVRLYIDEPTNLVVGMEQFARAGSQWRLRARSGYEYDVALPPVLEGAQ
jgi:hypothetical protein